MVMCVRVSYFLQVKPRFTTLFLAALLALTTSVAVPTSSLVVTSTYAISRCEEVRRAHQKLAEQHEPTLPPSPRISVAIPSGNLRGQITIVDQSMFQRPPPDALLRSV